MINEGTGHDIITDFHASGNEGVQDLLYGDILDVTLEKDGKNVIVHYSDFVSLTLLDVRKSEIDATDFGGVPMI